MKVQIKATGQACGAVIEGVDLSEPLHAEQVRAIREAWLENLVLSFPGQQLSDDDLERFSQYFGPFGDDPFIAPVAGRKHIIAVQRKADETAPVFAESWHTDWSFQAVPPDGTCLYSLIVPPKGGDTLFANQHLALQQMPDSLRQRIAERCGIHTAKAAYAPDGAYGEQDQASDRSMDIRPSSEAVATQLHPLIRKHPETGKPALFGCLGYILGVDGMADDEAFELLAELHTWQTREEFQYRHRWEPGTLLMWDNRSVLHMATGGYDGHDRLLHRTTIAGSRF